MNNDPPTQTSQAVTFTLSGVPHLGEVLSMSEDQLLVRDLLPASLAKSILHADPPTHTAQHEVFRLSSTRTVLRKDVGKSFRLVDLLSFRPGKPNLLSRQHYDPESMVYSPEVPPFKCVCGKVLNPDENYSLCIECPAGYHNECLSDQACPVCEAKVKVRKDDVLVIESVTEPTPQPTKPSRPQTKRQQSAFPPVQTTLQSMRAGVVSSLESALGGDPPGSFHPLCTQIEQALFEASGGMDNSTFYTRQARALKFNLAAKDNPELRTAVVDGGIDPGTLVRMTSQEMANSKTKQMRLERGGAEFIEKRRKMDTERDSEGESDDPFDPDNH